MGCIGNLKGISRRCGGVMGGIKKLWMSDFREYEMAGEGDGKEYRVFIDPEHFESMYEYEFGKGTASANSTATIDAQNDIAFFTTELTAQFNGLSADRIFEMKELLKSGVTVLIQDNNDDYYLLNPSQAMYATAMDITIGAQATDASKMGVTLQVQAPHPMMYATIEI